MDAVATPKAETTRLTVDVPEDDYLMLKVAVAASGRGVTVSSVIRELIHDYLERLQDDADYDLVDARRDSAIMSGIHVRARFARPITR